LGDELPPLRYASLEPGHNCAGFKCTNREITQWVRKEAHKRHSDGSVRVTCAVPEGSTRPIGIYALATVAEDVSNLPGIYHIFRASNYFSALQLVWLATDKGFTGRGLGKTLVGQVILKFVDIGSQIGLPHLIVTPAQQDKEELTDFYGELGFTPYNDGESMFLSLQAAQHAVVAMRAATS
jgi:GNAT superfamily N-acetyltransferase